MTVVSPPEGDLPRWVRAAGARHLSWRAGRSPGPSVPGETRSLGAVLRDVSPDLVHLHSAKAGLAGRLGLRGGVPTVFQPHAWSFLATTGAVALAARTWERHAARWADAIVCVSEEERLQGERAGVRGRWAVVPNGVDLERFRPADRDGSRSLLGLDDGPLVVCVGRLSRQKGQDVLLAAWPSVTSRVPGARLALVGSGPEESVLRRTAPPGVLFPGATTEVEAWLGAADVVALPSRWEGMSLAMLETMAAGRSLVISDVPGAREAVRDDVGAVVPVDDPGALARAVATRLIDADLRRSEGAAGRRVAEDRFGLQPALETTLRLYERILVERSSPRQP